MSDAEYDAAVVTTELLHKPQALNSKEYARMKATLFFIYLNPQLGRLKGQWLYTNYMQSHILYQISYHIIIVIYTILHYIYYTIYHIILNYVMFTADAIPP